MGMNYYTEVDGEKLHIGKSSYGWCFALHVFPEKNINDWDDWKRLLSQGYPIQDEDDKLIKLDALVQNVEDREFNRSYPYKDIFESNKIISNFNEECILQGVCPGPNGLFRHKIDKYCIKHGEGTWDCLIGEFS